MLNILFIVTAICFAINVPIGFALGIGASFSIIFGGNISMIGLIPQRMVAGVNSFPLLAIPFFMLAGEIMAKGGVSKRIVILADSLVGWLKGGLSAVSILSCTFFAAISGSTPATAAAVGNLTIPEMESRGYPKDYASAVVASSACLGVIIPPSVTMVIYGVTASVSIGKLLIGGIIPGLFLSALLLLVNWILAGKVYKFPTGEKKSASEILKSFIDAIWALIMPMIILGGIMTGIFTPTESAAVAVVYGLIVGFFVYKELKVNELIGIFYKASLNSAMVMLLIAIATPFGWIMTAQQFPAMASEFILGISNNADVIYAIVLILYLILGTFMETGSIILLVVPILAPIMHNLGVDPVHFGVVTVISLAIGMATPPLGISLFATAGISGVTLSELSKAIWPFLIILIIGVFILAYVPAIVTILPDLVM